VSEKADAKPEIVRQKHTPNALAIRGPFKEEFCELIITTEARTSQVYALTYDQICLIASQSELARISFLGQQAGKKKKS
jgi:hypothetical protein